MDTSSLTSAGGCSPLEEQQEEEERQLPPPGRTNWCYQYRISCMFPSVPVSLLSWQHAG